MALPVQVFIDANGQLGTLTPPAASGTGMMLAPFALEAQLREQQAINTEQQDTIASLRVRLARLEALVQAASRRR